MYDNFHSRAINASIKDVCYTLFISSAVFGWSTSTFSLLFLSLCLSLCFYLCLSLCLYSNTIIIVVVIFFSLFRYRLDPKTWLQFWVLRVCVDIWCSHRQPNLVIFYVSVCGFWRVASILSCTVLCTRLCCVCVCYFIFIFTSDSLLSLVVINGLDHSKIYIKKTTHKIWYTSVSCVFMKLKRYYIVNLVRTFAASSLPRRS